MVNRIKTLIDKKYPLTEIDCGEFGSMKVGGIDFSVSAYKAEGLGHMSIMSAKGFFGLMKMDTLIINPTEIDLPLYSYDRIFAMGNDTLIVELYDTTVTDFSEERMNEVKAREMYSAIPERDPGEHWYDSIKLPSSISKKGGKKHFDLIESLAESHFEAYIASDSSSVSDREAKRAKACAYVNGLLQKGGPSTDVFKKNLGSEKTKILFENFLFGTK